MIVLNTPGDYDFFNFGPSKTLQILGITIDSYIKYIILISYICINNLFKELKDSIVDPWLINDIKILKSDVISLEIYQLALFVSSVNTVYIWIDWFISIQMILTQFDLLCVEILSDLFFNYLSIYYYWNRRKTLTPNPNIANIFGTG
jgi:hypothetical protein